MTANGKQLVLLDKEKREGEGESVDSIRSEEVKDLLYSTHSPLIELCVSTLSAGNCIIALVTYIEEARPKATTHPDLPSFVALITTLRTCISF